MNEETNVQNLHITKYEIIRKSERATKAMLWAVFLISVITISFMLSHVSADKAAADGENRILTLLVVCPLCALSIMKIYIHASIVAQIISGKYKTVEAKVFSIKLANRFGGLKSSSDRIIELSNGMNLSVDHYKSDKFSVGDTAILVFADKNKYPIVFENAKCFAKRNVGD